MKLPKLWVSSSGHTVPRGFAKALYCRRQQEGIITSPILGTVPEAKFHVEAVATKLLRRSKQAAGLRV